MRNVFPLLVVPDWTKECTVSTMTGIQYAYLPEEVAVQLEVKCPLDEDGLRKVRCQGRQVINIFLKKIY